MRSDRRVELQSPSLRLALGLGDQELEQRLRSALEASDDLAVVAQCLSAEQLIQVVEAGQVDAILVGWSLHRLTDAVLDQLDRPGRTLVVLAPDPLDGRWRNRSGPVLPLEAEAATIHQAIMAARPGVRSASRAHPPAEPIALKPADSIAAPGGQVIAVTGGDGSPGRTTLAINLAAALGAGAPTVLVEADLCAPAMAAYLDRDPTRNLCTLAHAVREDARVWDVALTDELQPLGPDRISTLVLCGPPKREMRSSIAPTLIQRLVGELAQRFQWVVLDVGPELLGMDTAAASHRAALAHAHLVMLVSGADLVGLWHARTALEQLERLAGIEPRQVNLILNRHDPRFHHSRSEVEWHLGAPVAGVIPFDHVSMQRATSEQRPVVLDGSSRAARAIVGLADRLNEGKPLRLRSGSERASGSRQAWWRRALLRQKSNPTSRRMPAAIRTPVGILQTGRTRAW